MTANVVSTGPSSDRFPLDPAIDPERSPSRDAESSKWIRGEVLSRSGVPQQDYVITVRHPGAPSQSKSVACSTSSFEVPLPPGFGTTVAIVVTSIHSHRMLASGLFPVNRYLVVHVHSDADAETEAISGGVRLAGFDGDAVQGLALCSMSSGSIIGLDEGEHSVRDGAVLTTIMARDSPFADANGEVVLSISPLGGVRLRGIDAARELVVTWPANGIEVFLRHSSGPWLVRKASFRSGNVLRAIPTGRYSVYAFCGGSCATSDVMLPESGLHGSLVFRAIPTRSGQVITDAAGPVLAHVQAVLAGSDQVVFESSVDDKDAFRIHYDDRLFQYRLAGEPRDGATIRWRE